MKDKMERDLAYLATEDTRLAAEGRAEPERAATAGAENDGVFSFVADMNEIIFITDTDRGVIVASDLAREVFGISGAAAGRHIEDYLPKVYMDAISQRTKDEDARRMKLTFPVKDASGREVMLETRFNWFWLDGRRLLSITCRDINDIMNAMSDLTEREDRYRTIFRESPIGFVHVNSDGYITDCNNSFTAIFGLDKSDVVGVCLAEENSLDVYAKFKKAAMDAVVGFSSRHESQFSMRDDRGQGWVRVAFSPVISENHAFLGAIGIVEDITEAKNAADRINFVSSHDALTGLMNRRMCEEAIKNFENQGYAPLGVIYADLNCLKLANDAFGHAEGDRLLKTAARILADNAGRSGDAYRLGGDEFLLLIRDASAAAIEERVRNIAKTCVG